MGDLKADSGGITDNVVSKEECALNNILEDRIRSSLKIYKLQYLNHIPLEKISQIYIVLTDETIRDLTKKAESTPPLWDRPKSHYNVIMRNTGNGYATYGYFKKVVQELISQGFLQFQISNPGALELFEDADVQLYADYPLYCLNPCSAMKLRELGFCRHTLSPENDKANLEKLLSPNSDVIVYQDTPLFTSETCLWANYEEIVSGKGSVWFQSGNAGKRIR